MRIGEDHIRQELEKTLDALEIRGASKEKLMEYPSLFRTPVVRNGKQATVGYCPDVWESWK